MTYPAPSRSPSSAPSGKQPNPRSAPQTEIGYAQAIQYNWWLYEQETTPELQWPQSIAVYEAMRRTDSQVTSVLRAVTLPVRRTPWRIDPNGARKEVVEFVADDLGLPIVGQNPKPPPRSKDRFVWSEHLRQALLMLPFGYSYFEQVYRVTPDGSAAHLAKLALRPARTIEYIDVAQDGGLVSIQQYWVVQSERPRPIPVNRLVAYIHEREGGNWLGSSILRAAYKNWLLKDRLLRVQAQTIERNGMGIPLYQAQEGASAADIAAGLAMAKAWRSGEAAGSAVPNGADLVLRGVEGTLPDADPAIRYHDEQIARAVLAHFLNLGTQTGSWALGTTFADFFTLSLQTLAQQIADTATCHIIEDLVDINFGPDEPAPRVVFDEIGSRQAATAQALAALLASGAVIADENLEEMLRQQYGLPPRDPDTARTPPAAPPGVGADGVVDGGTSVAAAEGPEGRPKELGAAEAEDAQDADDEAVDALLQALAEFEGRVEAKFNPAELRDGHGRWRSIADRLVDALKTHHEGGGKGDPFAGFDREQLRRAAVKRGIKLKRGASREDISKALLDDLHGGSGGPSAHPTASPARSGGRDITGDRQTIAAAFEAGKEDGEWGPAGTGIGSQHGGRSLPDAGGYQAHLLLARDQGFDGPPRVLRAAPSSVGGDASEWTRLEGDGWKPLYRGWGWGSGDKTGADMAREYMYGPLHVGGGLGLGTNMSSDFAAANHYASHDLFTPIPGGRTVGFLLAPDARVISYPDAVKRRDDFLAGLPAGPEFDAERAVFADPGTFAMSLGFDAMVATPEDSKIVKKGTEEWVVFNRTKVAAWEDDPAGADAWKASHPASTAGKAKRDAARVRHAEIAKREQVANLLAEVDELIGKDASPDVIRERLDHAEATGVDPAVVAPLRRAVENRTQLKGAVTRAGTKHGLTTHGRAGQKVKFDPAVHEAFGDEPTLGAPVHVVRRGTTLTLDGETIPLSKAQVAAVGAKKVAPRKASPPPVVSPAARAAKVEDDISKAYAELMASRPPGDLGWVSLAALRKKLGRGHDRAEVDAALDRMIERPDVRLMAELNQKALTEADHAAAVRIGGEDRHLMKIDRPLSAAPSATGPEIQVAKNTKDLSSGQVARGEYLTPAGRRALDALGPEGHPRLAEIPDPEGKIREAFRMLSVPGSGSDANVSLADLRKLIGNQATRADIDAALIRIGNSPDGRLVPQAYNRGNAATRIPAAVRVGGEEMNMLGIDDPSLARPRQFGAMAMADELDARRAGRPGDPMMSLLSDAELKAEIDRRAASDPMVAHDLAQRVTAPAPPTTEPGNVTHPVGDGITPTVRSTPGRAASDAWGSLADPRNVYSDERKAEVQSAIRAEYAKLVDRPGGYVHLLDLRAALGSRYPRQEIDDNLLMLNRQPDVTVVNEANQKAHTPQARAAAVIIGGQDKHAIRIVRA